MKALPMLKLSSEASQQLYEAMAEVMDLRAKVAAAELSGRPHVPHETHTKPFPKPDEDFVK